MLTVKYFSPTIYAKYATGKNFTKFKVNPVTLELIFDISKSLIYFQSYQGYS